MATKSKEKNEGSRRRSEPRQMQWKMGKLETRRELQKHIQSFLCLSKHDMRAGCCGRGSVGMPFLCCRAEGAIEEFDSCSCSIIGCFVILLVSAQEGIWECFTNTVCSSVPR